MIPRAGNFKKGINAFNEYILHARPWAQCFTIIISFNSHHNLVRQLIFPPFYWWSSSGSKWPQVIAWQSLWDSKWQGFSMFWCWVGTQGKVTIPLANGRQERRWSPSLPRSAALSTWGCEVSGNQTQGDASATNLFRQPTYCRPRGACCQGLPSHVWENSHLHHYLCWLLPKNEELRSYHYPMTNTKTAGQIEEFVFPKSLRFPIT